MNNGNKLTRFEIQKGHFLIYDGTTMFKVYVDQERDFSHMPDLDVIYNDCQARGFTQEQTIDRMLDNFHTRSLIKGNYLITQSLVIGFVGGRGGGKSIAAAMVMLLDYLFYGYTVWSNMEVKALVTYKDCQKLFKTEPLDKVIMLDVGSLGTYQQGAIYIDEINTEIADALRSTSNKAKFFSDRLQQIRKLDIDVLWSTQNEDFTTSRTRWQTDLYIHCKDAMFYSGKPSAERKGKKSQWRFYDVSGVITGDIQFTTYNRVKPYKEIPIYNRPFWNIYDEKQLQGMEEWEPIKSKAKDEKKNMRGQVLNYILSMKDKGNFKKKKKSDIWEDFGVENNRTMQIELGKIFSSYECKTSFTRNGNYFLFPEPINLINIIQGREKELSYGNRRT